MKPADNINEFVRNAAVKTNPEMDEAVFGKLLAAHEETRKTKSALARPILRRTIMTNPITKPAVAAAAIIILAALGLFEFIDNGGTASVVWAEVARKVDASQGAIFRGTDTTMDSQDYTMNYLAATQSRHDSYKGDRLIKTFYDNYSTKTSVFVNHGHKTYLKRTVEGMGQDNLWGNPKSMVKRFLSHEHRPLDSRTVEGVLCQGIETTDPTFLGADPQVDSFAARVWVSVETGYPVKFEGEVVSDDGQMRLGFVADQFQWDAELDPNLFEPNIPPDYVSMENL